MIPGRRLLARVANLGLVASGLALVILLGTGGTEIDLGVVSLGLHEAAGPATLLFLFAALRLLTGSRHTGLESRVVVMLARQGLPPRDAPSTHWSCLRAGVLLGVGFGLVAAAADVVRVVAANPGPPLSATQFLNLGVTVGAMGALVGGLAGAVLKFLVVSAARALGKGPVGRYEAGRWTVAGLLAASPGLIWLAPATDPAEHTSQVLLLVAVTVVAGAAAVFLVLPVAVLRALRGRWGMAAGAAVTVGLVFACAVMVALGRAGLYAPTGDTGYPNVVLVSISGLRTDVVGERQGGGNLTPSLTRLAAEGSVFRTTVSPSTSLSAAAASMLTGLYPASHGLRRAGASVRPAVDGLPVVLAAHGFRTAAFVSCRELNGRDTGLANLFDAYDDPTSFSGWLSRTALGRFLAEGAPSAGVRPTVEAVGAFRDWVSTVPRGPWFAWIQLAGTLWPHPDPGRGDRDLSVSTRFSDLDRPPALPPAWAGADDRGRPLSDWVNGYLQAVRSADQAVETLRRIVLGRGELHHTLFVVTAEQGASLGEGGAWFDRGPGLPNVVLVTPWIVAGPGVRRHAAIVGPSSLVDVTPTILGLLGLGGGRVSEGEDLSRCLGAGAGERDPQAGPVFSESAPATASDVVEARAVWFGRWKLVRFSGGREEFFVVADDGSETPAPRRVGDRQRDRLSDMLFRRAGDESALAGGPL